MSCLLLHGLDRARRLRDGRPERVRGRRLRPGGMAGLRVRLRARADCDDPLRDRRRSEEHTSELQSPDHLVCRLLLEKKKQQLTNAVDHDGYIARMAFDGYEVLVHEKSLSYHGDFVVEVIDNDETHQVNDSKIARRQA